jgi:type I restriction enzyme S subunit
MNKIDELIIKLCPDGVPTFPLGEIGDTISGLRGKSKNDFNDGNAPFVSYVDISNNPALNFDVQRLVKVGKGENQNEIRLGDVLITGSSETKVDVGLTSVVTVEPTVKTYINSFCFIWRPSKDLPILPDFSKHLFRGKEFRDKVIETANGVTRQNISKPKLLAIKIPIPPIEVQKEIVNILDAFSNLESELRDLLVAELDSRKKQYTHFLESLFIFKKGQTKRWLISEICDISRGTVISKGYLRDHPGTYPVYSSQTLNNGIFGHIDTFAYDFESLTWTTDGANAGSIFYHQNEKFTITNVCGLLRVKDPSLVSTRYLYYLLKTEAPKHVSPGMGNPKIMAGTMGDISIDLPDINLQLEIVAILDKFDSLVQDISTGLPAEVKARHLQYEFYRNKLLTFKEMDVA